MKLMRRSDDLSFTFLNYENGGFGSWISDWC